MAQFSGYLDFIGIYNGSYDGRKAQVEIFPPGGPFPPYVFIVTFTDIDRNETYEGVVNQNNISAHIISAIDLTLRGGGNMIHWSKLLLHTWDISYMSGISVWNNTEYGMSFTRT